MYIRLCYVLYIMKKKKIREKIEYMQLSVRLVYMDSACLV